MKVSNAKSLPISGVKELDLRRKAGRDECACAVSSTSSSPSVEKFSETEATTKSA